jgi:hypothetical protein
MRRIVLESRGFQIRNIINKTHVESYTNYVLIAHIMVLLLMVLFLFFINLESVEINSKMFMVDNSIVLF